MEKKLYEQKEIPIPKKLDFEKHNNNVWILELIAGNDIFGEKLYNTITTQLKPLVASQSRNLIPQTQSSYWDIWIM